MKKESTGFGPSVYMRNILHKQCAVGKYERKRCVILKSEAPLAAADIS